MLFERIQRHEQRAVSLSHLSLVSRVFPIYGIRGRLAYDHAAPLGAPRTPIHRQRNRGGLLHPQHSGPYT